eukprot:scaffold1018_cov241-Pinguiococcus_pyrenoidosus.AAC.4
MACLFCHATLFRLEKKGCSSERSQTPVIGAIRRKLVTPQRLESCHWRCDGSLLALSSRAVKVRRHADT